MLNLVNKALDLLLAVIPKSKNTSPNVPKDPQINKQPINVVNSQLTKEKSMAISLEAFFEDPKTGEDRRLKYPNDYTNEILENAKITLQKINALLADLGIVSARVSSGWRPSSINSSIPGAAKRSLHTIGKAIDIVDTTGELDKLLEEDKSQDLLEKYGLWQEHPDATSTWSHIDCGDRPIKNRPGCKKRQFKP